MGLRTAIMTTAVLISITAMAHATAPTDTSSRGTILVDAPSLAAEIGLELGGLEPMTQLMTWTAPNAGEAFELPALVEASASGAVDLELGAGLIALTGLTISADEDSHTLYDPQVGGLVLSWRF